MPDEPTNDPVDKLVEDPAQAIRNIRWYQVELYANHKPVRRMSQARHWYAIEVRGRWLFAPSKFVGYAENTAEVYLERANRRNGRNTEKTLEQWFEIAPPETGAELGGALSTFLEEHGQPGPNRKASIHVLKKAFADVETKTRDRIAIDPAICGGRPCIRGTRVRVCDILELLAEGVPQSEILADYPYLSEADLRAALAYGAIASEHWTGHAA